MDFFRKIVSGDKRRYITDKFNLDLTYITDRVIAMAFPATGMEAAYRNDGTQVAALLKENHPGHFLVYNLTERKYDTTMFEGKVHDCGWFDHHAPPIGQLFEIVDHIHNFLLRDRENVVAIHCLAGKGRTGTVIVSYLLYSGLFHDPDEAALFFALRRSNNNWGVTGPSQQRYIRYFWDILRMRRAPNNATPLRLQSIRMSAPPKFTVGSKRSFTPIISAVDVSGGLVQQTLWTSRGDRTFTDDNETIVFDLTEGPDAPDKPILLLGDINFTVDSWGAFGRKSKFARYAFNTGMVINEHDMMDNAEMFADSSSSSDGRPIYASELASSSSNTAESSQNAPQSSSPPPFVTLDTHNSDVVVLTFPKSELDDACSDKRTPDGFYLEMVLTKVKNMGWLSDKYTFLLKPDQAMWQRLFSEYRDTNGVACFMPRQDMSLVQIISNARAVTDARSGEPPKMGGWLTKRGHRVKNWKKRWFALHTDRLEYSKSPKSTTPAGTIQLDDIVAVKQADVGECEFQNAFIIYTRWDDYVAYANNESDMEEWVNTLNLTLQIREQKRELSDATIGQLHITVLEITNVPSEEYYAIVQLGAQQSKAATTGNFGKEIVFDVYQRSNDSMTIQLWEENTYLPDALLGEIRVILDMFQSHPSNPLELTQVYGFRHQITRAKVRICYRPKALIEAQRPSLARTGSASIPVALNTSNPTRSAHSPARSLTLNSKVVSTSELKELVDILDMGLTEALSAPDLDHLGTDPVWDWSVQTNVPGGNGLPALTKEQRYSARPNTVDDDLPVYMKPLSMELGLPPSANSSDKWMEQHANRILPQSPKASEAQSSNVPASSSQAPTVAINTPPAVLAPISSAAEDKASSPSPNESSNPTTTTPISEYAAPSSPTSSSNPTSPNPESNQEFDDLPLLSPSEESSEAGRAPTRSASGSIAWSRPLAPSEHHLEPLMDHLTGKVKLIQSQGNTARDKRRARRATYDSMNPPEFKDAEAVMQLVSAATLPEDDSKSVPL